MFIQERVTLWNAAVTYPAPERGLRPFSEPVGSTSGTLKLRVLVQFLLLFSALTFLAVVRHSSALHVCSARVSSLKRVLSTLSSSPLPFLFFSVLLLSTHFVLLTELLFSRPHLVLLLRSLPVTVPSSSFLWASDYFAFTGDCQ